MMKAISSATMALLAVVATAPAFAQSAQVFTRTLCEIEVPPNVNYTFPDQSRAVTTFNTTKSCSGVASTLNIKLECVEPFPNWPFGTKTFKLKECVINADQCGIKSKPGDKNAPFVTATSAQLKVQSGIATLTCSYKP